MGDKVTALENIKKAHKSPDIGKRKRGKKTLLKEKANEEYIKDHIIRLAKSLPKISPKLIKLAKAGDMKAIKEIHDRVMGKSITPIEVTGQDGKPIEIDLSISIALDKIYGKKEVEHTSD